MGQRIFGISATFRRSLEPAGVEAGSAAYRAVSTAMRALAITELPRPDDYETPFAPTYAHVRRVTGCNVWLLYRFNEERVFLLTARSDPPVPKED